MPSCTHWVSASPLLRIVERRAWSGKPTRAVKALEIFLSLWPKLRWCNQRVGGQGRLLISLRAQTVEPGAPGPSLGETLAA